MTLAKWKRAKGKGLREMSRESGVNPSTLCRVLKGARASQPTMRMLVQYTGGEVTYDDLIRTADRAEASAP